MNVCITWLLLTCMSLGVPAKLKKTNLTPGISISLPSDFTLMTDDILARKYFTYRKPTAMYSDPSGQIDVGVNITQTFWQNGDLALLKDVYRNSLKAMYTKTTFVQEKVETIKKREYVVFEFIGKVEDEEKSISGINQKKPSVERYSYMMYTVVENRIIVVNFNCPASMRNQWEKTASEIMHSIKIKNLAIAPPAIKK